MGEQKANTINFEEEKDLVIKLSPQLRVLAKKIRDQANENDIYKRKLHFVDIFIHLLREYGEKSVPDLIKLREESEDRNRFRYEQSGSDLEYQDWLEQRLARLEEIEKKPLRKKAQEGVSAI